MVVVVYIITSLLPSGVGIIYIITKYIYSFDTKKINGARVPEIVGKLIRVRCPSSQRVILNQ